MIITNESSDHKEAGPVRRMYSQAEFDAAVAAERERCLAENERLRAELAEWHKLRDPANLHANLLRGIPCRLDRATFLHLAGDEETKAQGLAKRVEFVPWAWVKFDINDYV